MTERLLTLAELAELTGIPVKTLYTLCAPNGDLACVRTGIGPGAHRRTHGRIRVAPSAWADWQARHTSTPTPESRTPAHQASRVLNLPGADRYVS